MGGAQWTGGVTYLQNLAIAIKTTFPDSIGLCLLQPSHADSSAIEAIKSKVDKVITVQERGLQKNTPLHLIRKGLILLTQRDVVNYNRYRHIFRENRIDLVFGANLTRKLPVPTVGWFPDFQHVDLPDFFSKRERMLRDYCVKRMAQNCSLIVLSSNHARERFISQQPRFAGKTRVLSFVAHIPETLRKTDPSFVLKKYNLPQKYIYLPNQFWKHKNHLRIFQAIKSLLDRGHQVRLVCSGNMKDDRHPDYPTTLETFVRENQAQTAITMLGLVDHGDVYHLIRQSCFVINPSLYEGWSTTVEEVKSIGKPMLLSDIPVHREQAPPNAIYFNPLDNHDASEKILALWNETHGGVDIALEAEAATHYPKRIRDFAEVFSRICQEACNHRRTKE